MLNLVKNFTTLVETYKEKELKNLFTQPHTPAQTIFLHSVESAGLSALLTIMTAAGQYAILHGLYWPGLWGVLSVAFLAQMSMIYKSLASNPQTAQAIADTTQQIASQVSPSNQPGWPPVVHVDVPQLAATLKDELVKQSQQPVHIQTSTIPVQAQPGGVTTPLNIVKPGASTTMPPAGTTVPTWMQ